MTPDVYLTHPGSIPDVNTLLTVIKPLTDQRKTVLIVGDGSPPTPDQVVTYLRTGALVIQWDGWPWFGYGLSTGVPRIETVMAGAWEAAAQPAPGLLPGRIPFSFNPHDYAWYPYMTPYAYDRAFITASPQSDSGMPFYSAPTGSAFPNFALNYDGTMVYGFSGIIALCRDGGHYAWADTAVPPEAFGQFLLDRLLPQRQTTSPPSSGQGQQTTTAGCRYTVQTGDTFSSIAASHGLTLTEIEALNPNGGPNHNYNVLYPNQTVYTCAVSTAPPTTSRQPAPTTPPTYTPPTSSKQPSATIPTVSAPSDVGTLLILGALAVGALLLAESI